MTGRTAPQMPQDVAIPERGERKPWSAPVLTIRSIEDVTHGTRASVNTDATEQRDNS